MASVHKLKERLARTLKAKKLEGALATIHALAEVEPDDPIWPKRAARLLGTTHDLAGQRAALHRALVLQIDQSRIPDAITTCKAILEIAPDDDAARDCLDRLYLHGASDLVAPELDLDLGLRLETGKRGPDPFMQSETNDSSGDLPLQLELANLPLSRDLDPASLHMLIRRVRVVEIEAGQVLFRQGDDADSLYVVVEGAVVPIAEGDRRRKLAVLERGELFGEIGLLTNQPRNATVEGLVDTKLLAIDRKVLRDLIERSPSVAQRLAKFLRGRLIDRQIRTNLFFAAFSHSERESVARQFRILEVADGAHITKQGRPPEGLFLVLAGRLELFDQGRDEPVGELGAGDVSGGMSLLDGQPSSVEVIARGQCWLFVLGEARFRRLIEANPRLIRVLRRLEEPVRHRPWGSSEPLLVASGSRVRSGRS